MAKPFWVMRYREARTQALLLATIAWLGAVVIIFARPGDLDLLGHVKGADFVHFYTLGRIAVAEPPEALYDATLQHQLQSRWVPASASDFFVPVYPPQMAMVFAPLAFFSYYVAALIWAAITIAVYVVAVRTVWQHIRLAIPDGAFVAAAAAAFPPFWSLVLHGQTTTIPLAAFFLCWLALERHQRFLAGACLGLIAIKPQLGLVIGVVLIVCGEWSMLTGLALSVCVQLGMVWSLIGWSPISEYVSTRRWLPNAASLIEPKPYQLHSIRSITRLFPNWLDIPLWMGLSVLVIRRAILVWKANSPLTVRLGVLIVATVLVSPHLFIYDATLLVLPGLWLGAWIQTEVPALRDVYWSTTFWLFVTLLIPSAALIRLQLSVVVLFVLFLRVSGTACRTVTSRA